MIKVPRTKRAKLARRLPRTRKAPRLSKSIAQRVSVERPTNNFLSNPRFSFDWRDRKSLINLILGVLVLVVMGSFLFNYLAKRSTLENPTVGPSQQTASTRVEDVTKDSLPGKYTIKDGDTLFKIAQFYYGDGYKYPELVKANKIANENVITTGQVLEIPKLTQEQAGASPAATAVPETSPVGNTEVTGNPQNLGTGGPTNQTIWGGRIDGTIYTVQEGDWLSKIAGRAYGDIMKYPELARVNNITNPDLIEPGMVLKIPR